MRAKKTLSFFILALSTLVLELFTTSCEEENQKKVRKKTKENGAEDSMNHIKQIHAHSLRTGFDQTKFLILKLLDIPCIIYAHALFDQLRNPTAFLYNKLIQFYSSHGPLQQCLLLYSQMCLRRIPPNQYSFPFLFKACASLSAIKQGQMLHTHILKLGFVFDVFVLTSMVDMYAKSGDLCSARQLFDKMTERDVVTWNSLIAGYGRSGELKKARDLFEQMPRRTVVSWTAMISGYAQNGQFEEALEVFQTMLAGVKVKPNEVTIASILPACAHLGALDVGERIDKYARENDYKRNIYVSNSLVEMYAKCGIIDRARQVFDEIPDRNLCSWNSMIMGLAVHGKWKEAITLFEEMQVGGISPDDITFTGVLCACSHGRLVNQGWRYFKSMQEVFSITPKLQHYGCMIDLLGRAGHLNEAYSLVISMPMKPDSVIWGALLGACSFYSNVELAEIAAEFLFELEPWNPGNYVILSNIYAARERWDGVAKMRMLMKDKQFKKTAGYSLIELGGCIHKFLVEDRSHPRSAEIYALLDEVSVTMKLLGYLPNFDFELDNQE